MIRIFKIGLFFFIANSFAGCMNSDESTDRALSDNDSIISASTAIEPTDIAEIIPPVDSVPVRKTATIYKQGAIVNTGTTSRASLLEYAKTLIGVPYLYASTDPAQGFDCSGFITHVFNHFDIAVPRSSVDFTNVGTEVTEAEAAPGDLILFTGTDSTIRIVGHMGIIENNQQGKIHFIHSSSGKANGVVITPLERYYRGRFVKIIRVFPG